MEPHDNSENHERKSSFYRGFFFRIGVNVLNLQQHSRGIFDGVLTYQGNDYPFSFDAAGLSREVNVNMNLAELSGEVFNLSTLEDFNGNYAGVKTGMADEGVSRATIQNQNGVIVSIVAKTPGLKFQLGAEGLKIELKKQ